MILVLCSCQTEHGNLIRIRLDFFSSPQQTLFTMDFKVLMLVTKRQRGPQDQHKIYIDGQTPQGTWQNLWEFKDYLPDTWKQMP